MSAVEADLMFRLDGPRVKVDVMAVISSAGRTLTTGAEHLDLYAAATKPRQYSSYSISQEPDVQPSSLSSFSSYSESPTSSISSYPATSFCSSIESTSSAVLTSTKDDPRPKFR